MFVRTIAAALLLSGAALAQANGNYSGTEANGAGISMTVATDTTTGLPEITGFSVGITGNCKPSGMVSTSWGFGPNVDIVNNKAKVALNFIYDDSQVSLAFGANNTVSGTVQSVTPILLAVTKGFPRRALFCFSPKQSFTMTYQGAAAVRMPAHTNYVQ